MQSIDNLDHAHILEPECPFASPKPNNLLNDRRFTIEMFHKKFQELKIQESTTAITCRVRCFYLHETIIHIVIVFPNVCD